MYKFLILLLFFLPEVYSYIDPGTGGYLLSSIWTSIVTFTAIVVGVIINFFRHTLKNFIKKLYKKYKVLLFTSILVIVLLFIFSINLLFFSNYDNTGIKKFDNSLNGVQIYDKEKSFNGYNLYEGKLMDMEGNIIQEWEYSYLSILDLQGNYYAQEGYETLRWGKFSFNGTPIWIKEEPIHHEIYITQNNTIIIFTKEAHEYHGRMVEFDIIIEYDQSGNEIQRWSTWENLNHLQQFHRPLELDKPKNFILPENHRKNTSIWGANYDYYHLNSFSIVPENNFKNLHPAFKPGNWIISFRHGSMTFILDKDTKQVLWRGIYDQIKDNLEGQHVAYMNENGQIIIFDNGRYRGWSRIVTIDPLSMNILSEYKDENFFTNSQGYFQILENGNYLITESEEGRIFEINPDGEIVWEYNTPVSIEDPEYGVIRDDVYRLYRYNTSFIENLIK